MGLRIVEGPARKEESCDWGLITRELVAESKGGAVRVLRGARVPARERVTGLRESMKACRCEEMSKLGCSPAFAFAAEPRRKDWTTTLD